MIGEDRQKTGRPKKGSYREGRCRKMCVRMSEIDIRKLNYICSYYGITKSDFVASSIEEEVMRIRRREEKG